MATSTGTQDKALELIQICTANTLEVAAYIKSTRTHALRALQRLRDKGEAHICGWERLPPTYQQVAVWKYGSGRNAPRLAKFSKVEIEKRFWQKNQIARRARIRGKADWLVGLK